jgi:DNA polymerase I
MDVSYEVEGNKPVILIWAIDESGRRVLLKDERFRPYFYVLPKEGTDVEKLVNKIRLLSKPKSPIINIELVEKKLIGRPKKALKVTTVLPESVRDYREEIKKLKEVEDVLEADIRFAMRYIIDKDIRPNGWIEAEVKEVTPEKRYRIEKEFKVLNDPVPVERDTKPDLKMMSFDIEVYNKH